MGKLTRDEFYTNLTMFERINEFYGDIPMWLHEQAIETLASTEDINIYLKRICQKIRIYLLKIDEEVKDQKIKRVSVYDIAKNKIYIQIDKLLNGREDNVKNRWLNVISNLEELLR